MAIENIAEIEKSLGLEEGKLTEMISSEEKHTIDLTNKVILDKPIYEERISNIKKETINTTQEVLIKEVRNALELDFQGKTKENLIDAFKGRIEAAKNEGGKPDERYTALKTDFDKLQQNLNAKNTEFESLKNEYAQKEKTAKIQSDVFKHIPDETLVSKNTILLEAQTKGYTFDEVEGLTVVKKNGEIVKNEQTLSPISIKDWAAEFVTPFVGKPNGGSGGKDDKGAPKVGSFEAFLKEAETQGWDATRRNQEIIKRTQDGTLKM